MLKILALYLNLLLMGIHKPRTESRGGGGLKKLTKNYISYLKESTWGGEEGIKNQFDTRLNTEKEKC